MDKLKQLQAAMYELQEAIDNLTETGHTQRSIDSAMDYTTRVCVLVQTCASVYHHEEKEKLVYDI